MALLCLALPVRSETLYATDGSSIFTFDSATPGTTFGVSFSNLQGGETIVGIDLRPSNLLIYGVGTSNQVYTINPVSGFATPVGAAGSFSLSGTSFGMDFNPQPDRIRLVSNAEQNLRLHPDTGQLVLADSALNPPGNVVAAAYDRNDNDNGTLTTLFGVDSASGNLIRIGDVDGTPNSPNTGIINTIGSLTLGTNLNPNIGMDISGLTGIAYATVTTGAAAPNSRLYSINLLTGLATDLGAIGNGLTPMLGITAAAIPEPGTYALLGVGALLLGAYRKLRRRS